MIEPVEKGRHDYTCTRTCPSSIARRQRRQRRRRRAVHHVALHVEDAAVARTQDALRSAIVGSAAAEVRAGRVHRPHVLFAGAHQIDDRAIDDLRIAVLPGDAHRDRQRLIFRERVERRRVQPGRRAPREARRQRGRADDERQGRAHRRLDGGNRARDKGTAPHGRGRRKVIRHVRSGEQSAASLAQGGKTRGDLADYTGARHRCPSLDVSARPTRAPTAPFNWRVFDSGSARLAIVFGPADVARHAAASIARIPSLSRHPDGLRLPAPPPATWPFLAPPMFDVPAAPALIWAPGFHDAFVNHQTAGTRLVTSQAIYLMQAWLEPAGDRDLLLLATAERSSLPRHAPEVLARRGVRGGGGARRRRRRGAPAPESVPLTPPRAPDDAAVPHLLARALRRR